MKNLPGVIFYGNKNIFVVEINKAIYLKLYLERWAAFRMTIKVRHDRLFRLKLWIFVWEKAARLNSDVTQNKSGMKRQCLPLSLSL